MERMASAAEADHGLRHILKSRLSETVFFAPRMRTGCETKPAPVGAARRRRSCPSRWRCTGWRRRAQRARLLPLAGVRSCRCTPAT